MKTKFKPRIEDRCSSPGSILDELTEWRGRAFMQVDVHATPSATDRHYDWAGVAALLGFLTHMTRLLRLDSMMRAVHDETDAAISASIQPTATPAECTARMSAAFSSSLAMFSSGSLALYQA